MGSSSSKQKEQKSSEPSSSLGSSPTPKPATKTQSPSSVLTPSPLPSSSTAAAPAAAAPTTTTGTQKVLLLLSLHPSFSMLTIYFPFSFLCEVTAEDLKQLGNKAFTSGDHVTANTHFTAAIDLDPTNHILYSNRSVRPSSSFTLTLEVIISLLVLPHPPPLGLLLFPQGVPKGP